MPALSELPHDFIILDACCALTLAASGHMSQILEATHKAVAIARYVAEHEVKSLSLQPLIDAGELLTASPQSEAENDLLVSFAVSLEDGEALTGAIASSRNWAIATDETKALAFLQE